MSERYPRWSAEHARPTEIQKKVIDGWLTIDRYLQTQQTTKDSPTFAAVSALASSYTDKGKIALGIAPDNFQRDRLIVPGFEQSLSELKNVVPDFEELVQQMTLAAFSYELRRALATKPSSQYLVIGITNSFLGRGYCERRDLLSEGKSLPMRTYLDEYVHSVSLFHDSKRARFGKRRK